MEVGMIYSSQDPNQIKARDFVKDYIQKHGISAVLQESDQPVNSLRIFVDGEPLMEKRKHPRTEHKTTYPDFKDIARLLELHLWTL